MLHLRPPRPRPRCHRRSSSRRLRPRLALSDVPHAIMLRPQPLRPQPGLSDAHREKLRLASQHQQSKKAGGLRTIRWKRPPRALSGALAAAGDVHQATRRATAAAAAADAQVAIRSPTRSQRAASASTAAATAPTSRPYRTMRQPLLRSHRRQPTLRWVRRLLQPRRCPRPWACLRRPSTRSC